MRTFLRVVDSISEWTGKTGRWFAVGLVLIVSLEVILRFVFNRPTLWAYETSVMLGACTFVLAFAYVHRYHAHIRVDVFYTHLSNRGKAIIDVLGDLLLFFPLIFLLVLVAWDWMTYAWTTGERMPITGWYPPAGPLRTVVALGFILFVLQGVAQFIRDLYLLVRNKPYD
ncbi:MAG TPA: TRAP transporter small permease subunit [Dehalococcoidales bacterium]|nr:TRAP transporter small permease subunit [Dehalococcoidales bacterium]